MVKQAFVMTAMFANSLNSGFEDGNFSGLKYYSQGSPQQASSFHPMPALQQMSSVPQMSVSQSQQISPMPFSQMSGPYAHVAQNGSGTYNNFRGPNFKSKGKGKKFYSSSQPSFRQPSVIGSQSSHQSLPRQAYQPFQFCQICNRKGHTALTCFQKGCQIYHRVGHTAATYFDKTNFPSQSMLVPHAFPPYSQQFQSPSSTTPFNGQNSHMMAYSSYNPAIMVSHSVPSIAMTARTNAYPSAPSHEYWLLDSGATNHMTSDLSNLQMATPYPSSDTVTGANGEGLHIANIGKSNLSLPSHSFQLKSLLHVPKLSQHVLKTITVGVLLMNSLCAYRTRPLRKYSITDSVIMPYIHFLC